MGKKSEGCLITTSRKEMTRTLFTIKHLEPCRVRMSEMWHAQREKCACVRVRSGVLSLQRRVQGSCHCLDAKSKKRVLQINNYGFSVVEVCNKKC